MHTHTQKRANTTYTKSKYTKHIQMCLGINHLHLFVRRQDCATLRWNHQRPVEVDRSLQAKQKAVEQPCSARKNNHKNKK
jgi:hypothetical protein